jgi:hypothetical protein
MRDCIYLSGKGWLTVPVEDPGDCRRTGEPCGKMERRILLTMLTTYSFQRVAWTVKRTETDLTRLLASLDIDFTALLPRPDTRGAVAA